MTSDATLESKGMMEDEETEKQGSHLNLSTQTVILKYILVAFLFHTAPPHTHIMLATKTSQLCLLSTCFFIPAWAILIQPSSFLAHCYG